MKHFVIGESHLTLSEVQYENKGKEDYRPEKKVADHHWPRTQASLTTCKRESRIVKMHYLLMF